MEVPMHLRRSWWGRRNRATKWRIRWRSWSDSWEARRSIPTSTQVSSFQQQIKRRRVMCSYWQERHTMRRRRFHIYCCGSTRASWNLIHGGSTRYSRLSGLIGISTESSTWCSYSCHRTSEASTLTAVAYRHCCWDSVGGSTVTRALC